MMRRRTPLLTGCTALALTLGATACGGGDPVSAGGGDKALSGQTVSVAGVWSGSEQKNFQKVLDAFTEKTGARTQFVSTGDNVSTVVGSKIEGGNAPDVVMVPQVGVLQQFAGNGWLKPLSATTEKSVGANYASVWKDYGSVDGTLYGLYFKAAHKSTVWYSPDALDQAGVQPPKTYDEMLKAGRTVSDSGLAAFSVAGQDGWTLTDWFENVYLSQAGPEKYDALAAHKLKWTDQSVVDALTTLGELFQDKQLLAGGQKGALNTDFPGSVEKVFGPEPEAGMVYEGDFVAGVAKDQFGRKIGEDADFFPFPPVGGGEAPVVSGGDAAVVLKDGKDTKAGMALLEYLATPEAAAVWAGTGGFLSPNKKLDLTSYGDDVTRTTAKSLIAAGDSVRFDMSDQAPASFGGTKGAGEWKILQDFLRDPSDPKATAAQLETAAAKAYKD
ncbi:ABC transporter substrate-binding protein [Streptomyces europaeiscabiei]|uniref:ABC transporter substrate-binding protein n=1 Tax=Streptomyces europaeiscabiei TaxID=146819 RepID=A0ABU4NJE0_9ACTN|nr:ABC transporter substrate-binding protein [Streptomyces europaeiscabiei]MDX2765516.1 ABC transporter substrate-binding protein [Streptomyces europaeiscabiei]MDX3545610.1 ABC transporter substrate-binding protein [Streptomyces europaeiscabiei]MDX3554993.1 ABC transporter substrate-binding protein [Streptomyces europaeiscabiei]MDX3702741.1 ABC transporter substrate-binding protein [Streptomyces europaeiscabiei]MDX3710517.1 ABC transporter substrate-binding protein [Streptomyces europaeiscabie